MNTKHNVFCCPICGDTTFPLLPVGSEFQVLQTLDVIASGHRYQRCHKCKSSDRDRLVFLYLQNYTNLLRGDEEYKLLHVAPEDCLAKIFLRKNKIRYIPIDSFEHGYFYPDYLIKMDLLSLEIENNSMDFVICNHVLQDINNDKRAMSEIFRVLKPGGQAIIQVPISNKIPITIEHEGPLSYRECEKRYGHRFHKRIYSQDDFLSRLTNVGFRTQVIKVSCDYDINSLNSRERIYLAIK